MKRKRRGWVGVLCLFVLGNSFLCTAQDRISNRLRMAYEAHKRGLYSLSNTQIERYIREHPEAPDIDYAYLLSGVNFLYLEEIDKAIETLNIIRKKKPESQFLKDALSYLVLAYLKKKDIQSAISLYSEYKNRFSPEDFLEKQIGELVFLTAVSLFRNGEIRKSRELFNLLSTDFSSSEYLPEALYYEGLTYYQEDNFDRAIEIFKKAAEVSSSFGKKDITADIYLKLGDCFFNKKDYAVAEYFFNSVRNEFPDTIYSTWASFQMALIEKRKGNLETAVSLLEGLKSKEEEDLHLRVLSELANVKMLQEKWAESEIYLREISEISSESSNLSETYLKLGFVNFNMREWDDAIIYFRKVLEIPASQQTKESAYFWMGYTYYMKNFFNDAFSMWKRLQIEFPDSGYIHEILFFTGKRNYETGMYADADIYFTELIEKFPDSPFYQTATEMLVESKISQGKLNDALAVCEKFFEKNKSETVSFLYGKTLYLLKDFKKAMEVLEKVKTGQPSYQVEATYYLAGIYEKLGEIEKAQEKYLEIITFFSEFPEWVKIAEENLKRLKK